MNKKIIVKVGIPFAFVIIISMMIVILALDKPKNIVVTTLKTPYNIMSEINEDYLSEKNNDSFCIKLYVNQERTYYTNIDKIVYSEIEGDNSIYHLKIEDIIETEYSYILFNDKYYQYNYYFTFDFKFDDNYIDEIKDAKLKMTFSNGIISTLSIGSFSFYKYKDNLSLDSLSKDYLSEDKLSLDSLSLASIKIIHDDKITGLMLGIRNFSNKDIVINKVDCLDANIKKLNAVMEVESDANLKEDDIKMYYNTYPNVIDNNTNITIFKNDIKYLVIPIIYEDNELDILPGSFGFKVHFIIDGEEIDYYIPKMLLFDCIFNVNEDELIFYEYENK